MSLETGSKVEWSDIISLYNRCNTQRTRRSLNPITIPEKSDKIRPIDIALLNNAILDMVSTELPIPETGDLLEAPTIITLDSTLTALENSVVPLLLLNGQTLANGYTTSNTLGNGYMSLNDGWQYINQPIDVTQYSTLTIRGRCNWAYAHGYGVSIGYNTSKTSSFARSTSFDIDNEYSWTTKTISLSGITGNIYIITKAGTAAATGIINYIYFS